MAISVGLGLVGWVGWVRLRGTEGAGDHENKLPALKKERKKEPLPVQELHGTHQPAKDRPRQGRAEGL